MTTKRIILQGDAIDWLKGCMLGPKQSIITSLPDLSEMPDLGGFNAWSEFFINTAAIIMKRVHPAACAIFYQTDIKYKGRWIDKSYLVQRGAEQTKTKLIWHKIACRRPPGQISFGRPAYGHILCFSQNFRLDPAHSTADVLPLLGEMPWARATGANVSREIMRFIKRYTEINTIIDPFCGYGTILAAANEFGFDALGIERSSKRVKKARKLMLKARE